MAAKKVNMAINVQEDKKSQAHMDNDLCTYTAILRTWKYANRISKDCWRCMIYNK